MDVQLVLLKALAGIGTRAQEQPLREGTVLAARVLKAGAILLDGVRLAATLPEGLEPGALVRVKVREASAEKLVLQVIEHVEAQPASAAPNAPAPQPTLPVALPGGAVAQLLLVQPDAEDEPSGGGAARRGNIAQRIIEEAKANGVPIRDDAALAEALAKLELQAEIPEDLWVAVAEALVWAHRVDLRDLGRSRAA